MTQFFLDCPGYLPADKNTGLAKSYMKLMVEIWHKNRSAAVVGFNVAVFCAIAWNPVHAISDFSVNIL